MKRFSISFILVAGTALIVTLVSILSLAVATYTIRKSELDLLKRNSTVMIREVQKWLTDSMVYDLEAPFSEVASELNDDLLIIIRTEGYEHLSKMALVGLDGVIYSHSDQPKTGNRVSLQDTQTSFIQHSKFVDETHVDEPSGGSYDVYVPFFRKEKLVGWIVVGTWENHVNAEVQKAVLVTTLHLISVVACILLLIFLFLRTLLTQPIRQILKQINYIRETKDLSARLDINYVGELGILANYFNAMLSALNSSWNTIVEVHETQTMKALNDTTEAKKDLLASQIEFATFRKQTNFLQKQFDDFTSRVSSHFEMFNGIILNLAEHTKALAASIQTGHSVPPFQPATAQHFPMIMTTPITPNGEVLRFDALIQVDRHLDTITNRLPGLLSTVANIPPTPVRKLAILAPKDIQAQIQEYLMDTPYEITAADEKTLDPSTDAKVLLLHESMFSVHIDQLEILRERFPHMRFLILAKWGNPCAIIEGLRMGVRGAVEVDENLPQYIESIFDGDEVIEGRFAHNRTVALRFYDQLGPMVKLVFSAMFKNPSTAALAKEVGGTESTIKTQVKSIVVAAEVQRRIEVMELFE